MWTQFFTNRAVRELLHRNHPLARPTCLSCLTREVPIKNPVLLPNTNPREFRRCQKRKETTKLPDSSSLESILAE